MTPFEKLQRLCPVKIVRNVAGPVSSWQFDPEDHATAQEIAAARDFITNYNADNGTQDELIEYAAKCRWEFEQGGITLPNGMSISTDTAAQTKIAAALMAFDSGVISSVDFKTRDGFVTANKADLTAVYAAVVNHVQDAYSKERTATEAIAAGTVTKFSQVDAVFS